MVCPFPLFYNSAQLRDGPRAFRGKLPDTYIVLPFSNIYKCPPEVRPSQEYLRPQWHCGAMAGRQALINNQKPSADMTNVPWILGKKQLGYPSREVLNQYERQAGDQGIGKTGILA